MGISFSSNSSAEIDSGLEPTQEVVEEVEAFLSEVKSHYRVFTRNEVRRLRRQKLMKIWRRFVKRENLVFEQIQEYASERDPLKFKSGTNPCKYTLDGIELTVRPSGAPESLLHIIFEKPTSQPGTYSHLSSPTLDSGNSCTDAVMQKGLTSVSCFAFDAFSRRTLVRSKSGVSRRTVWEIDQEWNDLWDELHLKYRQLGGAITVIFGEIAFQAYSSVVEKEGSSLTKFNDNEECGYAVLLERSQVLPSAIISDS
jgi:hypothetical protein